MFSNNSIMVIIYYFQEDNPENHDKGLNDTIDVIDTDVLTAGGNLNLPAGQEKESPHSSRHFPHHQHGS